MDKFTTELQLGIELQSGWVSVHEGLPVYYDPDRLNVGPIPVLVKQKLVNDAKSLSIRIQDARYEYFDFVIINYDVHWFVLEWRYR